jgi:quinol monooxygenase YgiN
MVAGFVAAPNRGSWCNGPMVYAVIARYTCAPDDVDTVRAALLVMRDRTRAEPGNLAYVVHEDADTVGVFVLYEQYVDRAGFDAHTRTPHFEEQIIAVVRPLLEDRSVVFANVL